MAKEKPKANKEEILWDETPQIDEKDIIWDETPQISVGEGLLSGAQEGVTFGAASKLAGLAGALGGKFGGDARPFGEIYEEAKAGDAADRQAISEAQPVASTIGQLAGGILVPVPGGPALKGLGTVGRSAAQGAIGGALEGAGRSEGLDIPIDAVKGAVAGGVVGGGLGLVGKGISNAYRGIKNTSEKLIEESTGATAKQLKDLQGTGGQLAREGVVRAFDTPEKIAERAASMLEERGNTLETVLNQIDLETSPIRKTDLIEAIQRRAQELSQSENTVDIARKLEGELQKFGNVPELRPSSQVERVKQGLADTVNWDDNAGIKAADELEAIYRQAVEQKALQASPELGAQFKEAKQAYGLIEPVSNAAKERTFRERARTNIPQGISDFVVPRVKSTVGVGLNTIPRTIEGIRSVLPTIKQETPLIGMELEKALMLPKERAMKVIAPMLSQYGQFMEPSEYPSQFEGKLYSEEDKQVYSSRLKDELPPRERAKALSALNKDGSMVASQAPQAPAAEAVQPPVTRREVTISDMARGIKERKY